MPDVMTPEQCREHQRECALAVREEIGALRVQTAADIAAIRAAVQEIDRGVAKIKGFLGINGGDVQPIHHKRDSEQEEHLHRRITGLESSITGLHPKEGTVTLPKWFVWVTLGVMGVMLYLAAFAGPHGVEHATSMIPKP